MATIQKRSANLQSKRIFWQKLRKSDLYDSCRLPVTAILKYSENALSGASRQGATLCMPLCAPMARADFPNGEWVTPCSGRHRTWKVPKKNYLTDRNIGGSIKNFVSNSLWLYYRTSPAISLAESSPGIFIP